MEAIHTINRPELVTKQLKVGQTPAGGRRIRISSNFLDMMGFAPGIRTSMVPMKGSGLRISSTLEGKTKIYQRSYSSRKNNPFESLIDIQNQNLIEEAIPAYAERVHIQMMPGDILIRPLANESFSIRKKISQARDPFQSFAALTAGVDIHSMFKAGFSINSILEYRPQEARDKTDLTETGALNAIANCNVKNLFNEDITKINWDYVQSRLQEEEPISFLHISIQCDDHSVAKFSKAKKESIEMSITNKVPN